ncbi:MAG: hypothetical protein ABI718_12635 [Acidobacteriota bacterium]
MKWFNLSLVGWIILIIAMGIAAYFVHVPVKWIGVGVLALIGIGVIVSVGKSSGNAPPAA